MSFIALSRNVSREVANNLRTNGNSLAESIKRLSSGLRVQRPQDGIYEYMRGKSIDGNVRLYEDIRRNMGETESILNLATDASNEILDNLNSMLELARQGSDANMSAAERSAVFTEFNATRTAIDEIVKGTKYENGGILNAAGQYNQPMSLAVTPDRSVTMDIDLNPLDVTAIAGSGIVIDNAVWADENDASASATEIETALDTVRSFMSEVSGYTTQIQGRIRMADSTIENYNAAKSTLVGVDAAEEMANYTALNVTHEAGISMLAQANLSYRSILKLYEFSS
jgi:flagellin